MILIQCYYLVSIHYASYSHAIATPNFTSISLYVLYLCHSLSLIFVMAAMPFLCNGILLIQCNLPRIFPMSTLRQASFPIPYFKLF